MVFSSLGKPLASCSNCLIFDKKCSLGARSFFLVSSILSLLVLGLLVSVEKMALTVATRFSSRALLNCSSLFFASVGVVSENKTEVELK